MSALINFETEGLIVSCSGVNWESVMQQNEKRLYNFIRKRVSNFADVEDLVQSTWLEVLRSKQNFCGHSKPETWMFGIAINLIRNYYKSLKISYLHDSVDDEVATSLLHDECPDSTIENKDTLIKALKRVKQFPDEYQRILQLSLENNDSYQDIADCLRLPIGTVRSRLSRMRQTLKIEFSNE